MLIGTMNHPSRDIFVEIDWMAKMGMEFLDFTLEPPSAASWRMDAKAVRRALETNDMDVIGHTAYYLPICHPYEEIRRAAVEELKRCLRIFAEVGARWMNIHPDRMAPFHSEDFIIEKNLESLRDLLPMSREYGVGLMIENTPKYCNNAKQLGYLLDRIPELGLHLDIGHCNLGVTVNTTEEILAAYGSRLRHVHLHDNKGGTDDLHLPLGTGYLNLDKHIGSLRATGYDGMITLEVFSADKHYLKYSAQVLRAIWDAAASPTRRSKVQCEEAEHQCV